MMKIFPSENLNSKKLNDRIKKKETVSSNLKASMNLSAKKSKS
jgi:hypothetical protein